MDPLRLVQQIPLGLQIPRLRDRLVHIIADFRTQTSLREGCNAILAHDCRHLAQARTTHMRPLQHALIFRLYSIMTFSLQKTSYTIH